MPGRADGQQIEIIALPATTSTPGRWLIF